MVNDISLISLDPQIKTGVLPGKYGFIKYKLWDSIKGKLSAI